MYSDSTEYGVRSMIVFFFWGGGLLSPIILLLVVVVMIVVVVVVVVVDILLNTWAFTARWKCSRSGVHRRGTVAPSLVHALHVNGALDLALSLLVYFVRRNRVCGGDKY